MKLSHLTAQARLPTPLGPVTVAATENGLAGLWFDAQAHHPGELDAPHDAEQRWIAMTAEALAAFFGQARPICLPLDLQGTPFQRAVWAALCAIEPGRTSSYGALAAQLGAPSAARAVGAAVGRNPVSILVPCHRVLGHDGALTGYAGGLERKHSLLIHEGALTP